MKIIVFCISFWMCSVAYPALPYGSEFAGTYWSKLDGKTKPVFLTGFCLGAATFGSAPQELRLYPEQIPKLIPLIDAFYKEHSDSNMLIHYAVEICLKQLNGRPQAEIDEVIKEAQRAWK